MKCPLSKSLPKTLFYTTKCPAQPMCHEVSSLIASPHSFQIRHFSLTTLYCSYLCSYIFPFLNPLPCKWSGLGPCLMTLSEFYFALLLLKLSYGKHNWKHGEKFQIASAPGDKFRYHCDLCLCILNPFLHNCIALWNNNSNKNGQEVKRLNKTSLMKQVNLR